MNDIGKPIDVEAQIAAEFQERKDKLSETTGTPGGVESQPLHPVQSTSDGRMINNVMRHEYRVLSGGEKELMKAIKDDGRRMHNFLSGIGDSRELAIAKTKIEEAVMWAVKHITN